MVKVPRNCVVGTVMGMVMEMWVNFMYVMNLTRIQYGDAIEMEMAGSVVMVMVMVLVMVLMMVMVMVMSCWCVVSSVIISAIVWCMCLCLQSFGDGHSFFHCSFHTVGCWQRQ